MVMPGQPHPHLTASQHSCMTSLHRTMTSSLTTSSKDPKTDGLSTSSQSHALTRSGTISGSITTFPLECSILMGRRLCGRSTSIHHHSQLLLRGMHLVPLGAQCHSPPPMSQILSFPHQFAAVSSLPIVCFLSCSISLHY